MLDRLTIEDFRSRVDDTFKLQLGPDQWLPLRLVRVRSLSEEEGDSGRREPFSVEFRAVGEPPLAQRIYSIECGAWGSLEIFLVPIGPDKEGMIYEAVFT